MSSPHPVADDFLKIGTKIRVLPIVHGSGDFAIRVREELLARAYDCVAVPLPPSFQDETDFVSGISSAGVVISPTFATYNGEGTDKTPTNPNGTATYNSTTSMQFKWGSGTPGTASGTISYGFDPASNYTTVEIGLFQSSMALWSAEANITFAQASSYSTAALQYTRGTSNGAFQTGTNNTPVAVGGSTVGTTTTSMISIQTNNSDGTNTSFGPQTSVNVGAGYPGSSAAAHRTTSPSTRRTGW